MEKIKITITGSRTGDAVYNINIDKGELILLKMALAKKEQEQKI